MQKLYDVIEQDAAFARIVAAYRADDKQTMIYGLSGTQKSFTLALAYSRAARVIVVITAGTETLQQLRADLTTILPAAPVWELPPGDIVTFATAASSIELAARRMDILSRMANGQQGIYLVTAEAAMQKVLSKQQFMNRRRALAVGEMVNLDELLDTLVKFGYERVDHVDGIGQFSVRGGIVDIFAVNRELPVRLELFGDEIDSVRDFDLATQRSISSVDHVDILPLVEMEHGNKPAAFLSYLPAESTVIFDEPSRVREQVSKLTRENPEIKKRVFDWPEISAAAQHYTVLYLSLLLQKIPYTEPSEIISVTAKGIAPFHRQIELLISELKSWLERKYTLAIFMSTMDKAMALRDNLTAEGIRAMIDDPSVGLNPGRVTLLVGTITTGFELPAARLVVISEQDIFGRQKQKRRPRVAKNQQITYFRDINVGDYVVHVNHGIGKYVGVETLEVGGVNRDYLLIRYAGEDRLYVPTDQVNLLQKYIGSEGDVPRLNKMGGSEWLKTKTRAKAAVTDLAKDLLALYAERQLQAGYAFDPDTPWQQEFEEAFPFEETPDQLTAITQIKADMEQARPMDRLLCGDVGFGKTEVAIRAAFKAVMSGKQVAVLVPTTVLAQQHFQTFSSRFAGFGPTVDVISRFRSAKEQRTTLAKLAAGQVDVLIGTHRILQSDVVFKNLGLLIVDEEQRFGVAQKERIKKWRSNIDVLTLTATPIPRTLHMSLVGVRDMSIIETPPEERFPVQTYVVEYNEEIIREAIRRELKRGGQVYFVYNRVKTIDKVQNVLSKAFPDANIKVAHGQMPEELLEQVMLEFYEGTSEILVCTSIIENGLDVANANTIIVYDADRFGLSQLYQMRGRVGRSHRMAYAYFTYRRDKILSEVAEKRLQAIKEFTELGAGFKIAMRDLEIRGAGSILGAQQHGHIVSVGFEMYCRLLDEAIEELRTGNKVEPLPEPLIEVDVEAYLSGDYIQDAMHKIEIYQRIAAIRSEQHITDLVDELIDRFGEPTRPVLSLLMIARMKNYARELGLRTVIQKHDYFELIFSDQPNIDTERVFSLQQLLPQRVSLLPGPPEIIRLRTTRLKEPLLEWLNKRLAFLAAEKS